MVCLYASFCDLSAVVWFFFCPAEESYFDAYPAKQSCDELLIDDSFIKKAVVPPPDIFFNIEFTANWH